MSVLSEISEYLQQGDGERVFDLTSQAIEEGISPKEILDKGLIAGMDIIGKRFKQHEIFLPDVLMAARAMYAGMDQLKPLLIRDGVSDVGKVALGTVHGDLHDIGKNLVGIMLKGAGFEVVDLGRDVPADKFVEAVENEGVDVIGMSALLTTTMPVMKKVMDLLTERGLSDSVKIIIGGAPVSEEYAKEIGVDAYSYDAANAVDCVKRLLGGP